MRFVISGPDGETLSETNISVAYDQAIHLAGLNLNTEVTVHDRDNDETYAYKTTCRRVTIGTRATRKDRKPHYGSQEMPHIPGMARGKPRPEKTEYPYVR